MRRAAPAILALIAIVALIVTVGVTDALGTGAQLRTNLGRALPDGAAPDTFWDSAVLDVPGLSLTGVHCHGHVQYELQLGATGPIQDNACYAAMGSYVGQTDDWGVYLPLPGDRVVYRMSENYGPWRYCVAGWITANPEPAAPGPVSSPCQAGR